jgi:carotenoid 1,2-hydratase
VSEDGRHAVTVIAFIGSVFSPYYAWSGRGDPLNHVAVNVALYGEKGRWAMTERGRRHAFQTEDGFSVRNSGLRIEGDRLVVTVDERGAPLPRRVKGRITIRLDALCGEAFSIDRAGEHTWRPIAPAAPVEVEMDAPDLSWRGTGYVDMNWGRRPLEETFSHWDWMRVDLGDGNSAILYETEELSGSGPRLALVSRPDGTIERIDPPKRHPLPGTLWRVARAGWSDGSAPQVTRTLEDTPFYVRTELSTEMAGAARTAIQESLSLRRFKSPIVKLMLPFRMPRLP